jgi:exonuclease VII large subunit
MAMLEDGARRSLAAEGRFFDAARKKAHFPSCRTSLGVVTHRPRRAVICDIMHQLEGPLPAALYCIWDGHSGLGERAPHSPAEIAAAHRGFNAL